MINRPSNWNGQLDHNQLNTSIQPSTEKERLFSPIIEAAKNLYLEAQITAQAEANALRKERDDLFKRLNELQAELNASQNARDHLQEELDQECTARMAAEEKQQKIKAQISTLQKAHEQSLLNTTGSLRNKIQAREHEISQLNSQKEKLTAQLNNAEVKKNELNANTQHFENKARALESELSAMRRKFTNQTSQLNASLKELEYQHAQKTSIPSNNEKHGKKEHFAMEKLLDTPSEQELQPLSLKDTLSCPSSLSSLSSFPLKEDY